jgi:hypothetical protein
LWVSASLQSTPAQLQGLFVATNHDRTSFLSLVLDPL